MVRVDGPVRQQGIKGTAKVPAGHRDVIAGPRIIQLPPVYALQCLIKDIEIRRTGGIEQPGNLLGLVIQIGKGIPEGHCQGLHVFRRILGILDRVIGADRDQGDSPGRVLLAQPDQLALNMLYKRAVVAYEQDDGRYRTAHFPQAQFLSGDRIRQAKIRSLRAQRHHIGRCEYHFARNACFNYY